MSPKKTKDEPRKEVIAFKHKCKMEELEFERETNRLFHEWWLERGRIDRAEKRKMIKEKLEAQKYYGR